MFTNLSITLLFTIINNGEDNPVVRNTRQRDENIDKTSNLSVDKVNLLL